MMTTLAILVGVAVLVAAVLGVLAKMEVREIAAQCVVMGLAAVGFWGLVALL